jgi:hypothetical protein
MSVGHERAILPLMGCIQDHMGYTMAVGCCLKMVMPLFPMHVILELAIVRGTALKEG